MCALYNVHTAAGRIEISGVGSHYDRTFKLNTRVKDNSRKESSEKPIETHKNKEYSNSCIFHLRKLLHKLDKNIVGRHDFLFNVLIFFVFFFSSVAVVTRFLAKINLSIKSCDMYQSGQINTVSTVSTYKLNVCKAFLESTSPTVNNEQ
jgi:hypothetical protein